MCNATIGIDLRPALYLWVVRIKNVGTIHHYEASVTHRLLIPLAATVGSHCALGGQLQQRVRTCRNQESDTIN